MHMLQQKKYGPTKFSYLKRLHRTLELEVLFLDLLEQRVIDEIVVLKLERKGGENQDAEA